MATKSQFFNVLFLRPKISDNSMLKDILGPLSTAAIPDRTFPWGDHFIRFESLGVRQGDWSGDAVKLTPDLVQMKGKVHVDGTSPVDLEDDECIAHETAFLYSPTKNVLVLQRNHFGAGVAVFEHFLSSAGPTVRLLPIIGASREKRLRRIDDIRNVTFEVDVPAMRRLRTDLGGVASGIEAAADAVDAPLVTVTLKMGHRSGTLRGVGNALRNMLRTESAEAIKNVKVSGREEGIDRTTVIDLLEPTIVRRVPVGLTDGVATLEARVRSLGDALTSAVDEIDDAPENP